MSGDDLTIQVVTLHADGSGSLDVWEVGPDVVAALRERMGKPDYQATTDSRGLSDLTSTGARHMVIAEQDRP